MYFKKTLSISILVLLMIFSGSTALAAKTNEEATASDLTYSTHVENDGWQNPVSEGQLSGTEGQGLRLEAITIESGIEGIDINYETHIENIG
ncbi:MAG: thermitase [Eubacteriaceae bacterium]|nr:thermitase [Eubacteriaceae bacterium]